MAATSCAAPWRASRKGAHNDAVLPNPSLDVPGINKGAGKQVRPLCLWGTSAVTAKRVSQLTATTRNEIARLKGAGFHLLPLGGGEDGKAPMIRKWADPDLTLKQILGPMHRRGRGMYGVRLDGLAVIDCDDDDPALVEAIEVRFGPSPVHVQTPRGRHLYYRAEGNMPNLRKEGLPIDIKTGGRAYVVGPHSQRPDGGRYIPRKGVLGVNPLPVMRSNVQVVPAPAPVAEGERHSWLVSEAIGLASRVSSPEELLGQLIALRDAKCRNPHTVLDAELCGIANWAWQRRLSGRLYNGRNSVFSVSRLAMDALRGKAGGSDAISLYVLLVDLHGHTPAKSFALDHAAMKAAELTDLSDRAFLAARRLLQAEGLVSVASKYKPGKYRQQYRLERLLPGTNEASNIARMNKKRPLDAAGKAGGRD